MGPLVPRALAEANASQLPKSSSLVPSSLIQNKRPQKHTAARRPVRCAQMM